MTSPGAASLARLASLCLAGLIGCAPRPSAEREPARAAPSASAPAASLASGLSVYSPPSAGAPAAPAPSAAPPGEAAVMDALDRLHRALVADEVSLDSLERSLGRVATRSRASADLAPSVPWLSAVDVRLRENGDVTLLILSFPPGARPSLAAVERVFGKAQLRMGLHGERDMNSNPPRRGARASYAVIARLSRCADPHADLAVYPPCPDPTPGSLVEGMIFRRDEGG